MLILCTMRDMSVFFASNILKCIIASTLPSGERFVFRDVNDLHVGLDLLPAGSVPRTSASIFVSLQSPWPRKEDRVCQQHQRRL